MKKKLYLFRHGETDWNKMGRVQFSIDTELNETGIEQAKRNAESLKGSGIQHIYSSPLKRAYKTGKILADTLGIDIDIINDLMELKGGKYEGFTLDEIIKNFGQDNFIKFSDSKNDGLELSYPGGETKREIRTRIFNAVENICKTSKYDTIGIASHGFTLREFLRALDYEDDSRLCNCEIIEAEYYNDNLKIIKRKKN